MLRSGQPMEETNWYDTDIRISEIGQLIQNFKEKFKAGTSDIDNFMSITEIELLWGELQDKTNNIYSDMMRKLMSEVDERDLIRKKKENTYSKP
jgi:hypothetical protein